MLSLSAGSRQGMTRDSVMTAGADHAKLTLIIMVHVYTH